MKKALFAIIALATTLAVTSCQSDEEFAQQPATGTTTGTTTGKAYATGPNCEVEWIQL